MVKSGKGSRLYLLTGLVIGYVLAYIASCTVLPLEYYDINPASLHHDLKMDYFVLIADAFASNEDIGRAAARINALLDNPDMNDLRVLQFEIESEIVISSPARQSAVLSTIWTYFFRRSAAERRRPRRLKPFRPRFRTKTRSARFPAAKLVRFPGRKITMEKV